MRLEFDRASVCMGDDCMPHKGTKEFSDSVMLSEIIEFLTGYVPNMKNVVWAIISLRADRKTLGYIVTDELGHCDIDILEDIRMVDLFNGDDEYDVFCRYYHSSSFATGELKSKYDKYGSLIHKVKAHCSD